MLVSISVLNWFDFHNQISVWPNQSMINYIIGLCLQIVGSQCDGLKNALNRTFPQDSQIFCQQQPTFLDDITSLDYPDSMMWCHSLSHTRFLVSPDNSGTGMKVIMNFLYIYII